MMSVPRFGIRNNYRTNDRSSAQLRGYLRDEYHADIDWLYASVRSRAPPLRTRLRRWLGARRSRRPELPAAERIPEPIPPRADRVAAETCPHPLIEELGLSGDAEFLRCAVCGEVIVARGTRAWRLREPENAVVAPSAALPNESLVSEPKGL